MTPGELEAVTHWQCQATLSGGRVFLFGVTATGPEAAETKARAVLGGMTDGEVLLSPLPPPSGRGG